MTIEFFTLRRVKSQQLCQKELSSLLRKNLRSWIFSNTAITAFRCLSWRRARPSTRRRSSSRSADACSPTPEWRISGAWPSSGDPDEAVGAARALRGGRGGVARQQTPLERPLRRPRSERRFRARTRSAAPICSSCGITYAPHAARRDAGACRRHGLPE